MHRGFWIACVVLAFASRAHAATLHWQVPEGCPDRAALEQEAERVLGEPLAQFALEVNGVISGSEGELSLSLRITLPNSAEARERELQAASCQELLEAAAVAIALAAADSGEAPPSAVAQSTDNELPNRPPPPSAAEPEAASDSFALSAAAAGSIGALPGVGLGVDVQIAWMRDWLRMALGLTWFPIRSMQVADNTGVSYGMYAVEVLLCGQQPVGNAKLFACATGAVGSIAAHLDLRDPVVAESTSWRAVGALVGASYPLLPPLEVTAAFSAWAPFTRPLFYVVPSEEVVHEPTPVVAQLLLGVLFSL